MAEYAEMIAPKELRTLEIDIKNNIFKLNGDDLKKCAKLYITIEPEKSEVYVSADTTVDFSTCPT